MDTFGLSFYMLGLFTVFIGYIFYRFFWAKSNSEENNRDQLENEQEEEYLEKQIPKESSKSKKHLLDKRKEVKDPFSHQWLVSNLKGHGGEILDMDFSSNGKYLASCADDRSVMLWTVKTFAEKNHKSIRANIEYDHATHVKWSPDSKAFIVCVANENALQVYKVGKKKDGTLGPIELILKFPVKHNHDIINIGIACNGQFIMSCSSDTTIIVWNLKGKVLATIDTLHINNFYASISPCGRFIASSGFTPDVRVWEVCFNKMGEFKEVKRAFELKGHRSGVYHFSFSNDSTKMATLSKDGTWKLWDTNIEYAKGQEPYLIKSGECTSTSKSLIALSSDGRTVAIATNADIFIYSAITGNLQIMIAEIHQSPIRSLLFSPEGQYLIAAAGRYIRIFVNIPGYQNLILGLEESKKNSTNATMKERLQFQIDDAKSILKSMEEKYSLTF